MPFVPAFEAMVTVYFTYSTKENQGPVPATGCTLIISSAINCSGTGSGGWEEGRIVSKKLQTLSGSVF